MIEKFQFSFMAFGLRVEKWRNRKYSLYKFTFMPLIDKKIKKIRKKIQMNKKIKAPKVYKEGN